MNTADWLLDIASGQLQGSCETGDNTRLRCLKAAEDYLKQHPEGFMNSPDESQDLSSLPEVILSN